MEETARDAWGAIDAGNVGKLETSCLPNLLSELNMPLKQPIEDLESQLDRDGNGIIHETDFLKWVVATSVADGDGPPQLGLEQESMASSNYEGLAADELWKKVEKMAAEARYAQEGKRSSLLILVVCILALHSFLLAIMKLKLKLLKGLNRKLPLF